MLTALRVCDETKVMARNASPDMGLFVCPRCQETLVLKKGPIRVHHFAHKPTLYCAFGRPETEAHVKAKQSIYDALVERIDVSDLEMERDFGVSVADVYFKVDRVKVAVEIQQSAIGVNDIHQRTINYRHLGIYVLWAGMIDNVLSETYQPRAWERWLHTLYFGRVYYWMEGEAFMPIHYDPVENWVEQREWYGEDGDLKIAGGYYKLPPPHNRFHNPCNALVSVGPGALKLLTVSSYLTAPPPSGLIRT